MDIKTKALEEKLTPLYEAVRESSLAEATNTTVVFSFNGTDLPTDVNKDILDVIRRHIDRLKKQFDEL